MAEQLINGFVTTIPGALGTGDTTMTLATGKGALLPSSGGNFHATICSTTGDSLGNPTVKEIVLCTAVSGDVVTITRAQEGTTAISGTGLIVVFNPSAGAINAWSQSSIPVPNFLANVVPSVFIDSNTKSTVNNGTAAQPYKTIAQAVAASAFANNVVVGIVANSRFRETLDLSSYTGTTVMQWGGGNKPLFDCSDIAPNSGFTAVGGDANVYQATLTAAGQTTNSFMSIFENDVEMVLAASEAACVSTAGSYWLKSGGNSGGALTSQTFTVYVHAYDSSSPVTNGKLYEYRSRDVGYREYADGSSGDTTKIAYNVAARRNLNNNGSICPSGVSYGLEARQGTKHNMVTTVGSTLINPVFIDAYYSSASDLYTAFSPTSNGTEKTILVNPTFGFSPGLSATSQSTNGPIYMHIGDSTTTGELLIIGGTMNGGATAISATNVRGVTVTGMAVFNCAQGVSCYSNVQVDGCSIDVQDRAVEANGNGFNTSVRNSSLTSYLGPNDSGLGTIYIDSGAGVVDIEDNTISNWCPYPSEGKGNPINGVDSATKCIVRRNSINSPGASIIGFVTGVAGTTSDVQDNKYTSLLGNDGYFSDVSFNNYNLAQLRTAGPCESGTSQTQTVVPTTGNTVASNSLKNMQLEPTGTLATLTVTFPPSPYSGQVFRLNSSQIITALTVSASGKTISGTTTSLAVNTPVQWTFTSAAGSNTWVKG